MKKIEPCPLCSLPVKVTAFSLQTKEGEKYFCCAGCASIYQMLNQDILLTTTTEKKHESL